jgi:hypothetical protein
MILAPVLNKLHAESILSKRKRFWISGKKPVKIELINLPVYLFNFILEDKNGKAASDKISVDGIKGEFAFFRDDKFEESENDILPCPEFILSADEALAIAIRDYKRILFRNNLKTGGNAKITSVSHGQKIYYPFWIGYFRTSSGFDFKALDALDGTLQGPKMNPVFSNLIIKKSKNTL